MDTHTGAQGLASKIRGLDELARISADAKAAGETVVLAHGAFDLLHIGHIRHLEAAAREGSVLIVTVTADPYINKGPDRPVFNHQLRAEAVAALAHVDWVGINHDPSAEPVIEALKPSVYVKGDEYADADADVTGKIAKETAVVEKHGGRVVFTTDVTFSSSTLINRYLNVHDPSLKDYLARVRDGGLLDRLDGMLETIQGMKVLLVGDSIIDEYRYVNPLGKSPKENMIATLYESTEVFAGGVLAAANHIAEFCAGVEVITALGDGEGEGDGGYADFIRQHLKPNVTLTPIVRAGKPTTRKCRYVDMAYELRKLFEVYYMDDRPLDADEEAAVSELIEEAATAADVAIVTDFGHGLMTPAVIGALADSGLFLCVNAQSNSANLGFNPVTKYGRADYVCIDQPEARIAVVDKEAPIEAVIGELLPGRIDCPRIIVTRGKHGCLAHAAGEPLIEIPGFTSSIVDAVGAGDAFFAVSSLFVKAGAGIADAGFAGNAAGAIKVGIVGHRASVERTPFIRFATTLLK